MTLRKCPDHDGWNNNIHCYDCGRPTELGAQIDVYIPEFSDHPVFSSMAVGRDNNEYYRIDLVPHQFEYLISRVRKWIADNPESEAVE